MDVWRWGVKMAKKAWTYLKTAKEKAVEAQERTGNVADIEPPGKLCLGMFNTPQWAGVTYANIFIKLGLPKRRGGALNRYKPPSNIQVHSWWWWLEARGGEERLFDRRKQGHLKIWAWSLTWLVEKNGWFSGFQARCLLWHRIETEDQKQLAMWVVRYRSCVEVPPKS